MLNDRRRLWTSIIFFGLFAPVAVALLLLAFHVIGGKVPAPVNAPVAIASSAAGPATTPSTATATSTTSGPAPAAPAPAGVSDVPLLAASDGKDLWLMQPVLGDNKEHGFQLWRRTANTGVWNQSLRTNSTGTTPFWIEPTMPRGMVVMRTSTDRSGPSFPILMGDPRPISWTMRFSLIDATDLSDSLPRGHIIKAAAGSTNQLFAITLGTPVASSQPVELPKVVPAPPETAPASASAPTTTSAPAAPLVFSTYWYSGATPATKPDTAPDLITPTKGVWNPIASLGTPSEDAASVPKSSSQMTLLEQDGTLLLFWTDPVRPSVITLRTLKYAKEQQWSAPRTIQLAREIPAGSRLFSFAMDRTIYLLWTCRTGATLELQGGWLSLNDGAKLTPIADMPLQSAGAGFAENDVAVGPSENAIIAVVNLHDDLKSITFDSRGHFLNIDPVTPESPRHEVLIGQNIAMVLLIIMLILSLWQWRQKAPLIVMPKDKMIAPIHIRALAAGIDFVLPYAAVLLIMHHAEGGYSGPLLTWIGYIYNPEGLSQATDLFLFLAIYLGHIMIGEVFFRRSLGKWMTGLELMSTSGIKPGFGAILVRNLVRIPESAVGIVVLYVLISERRQRLGDLLAKTVVVTAAPEEPEDKDEKKRP